MILVESAAEQEHTANQPTPRDKFKLRTASNVTGWRFTLSGSPDHGPAVVMSSPTVHAGGERLVPYLEGWFDPNREDNAWHWHFSVPGPGVYSVTVERMAGENVSSSQTAHLHLQDFLVVSIGDSAASGQGNPDKPGKPAGFDPDFGWSDLIPGQLEADLFKAAIDYGKSLVAQHQAQIARGAEVSIKMDPAPVWQEPRAQRSLLSGASLAAKACEDLENGTVVTFLAFGRTGSDIPGGLLGPRTSGGQSTDGWAGDRGQVDELFDVLGPTRRIDALIIQCGVNDVGVAETLTQLTEGDAPILGSGDPDDARAKASKTAGDNLDALPRRFRHLADALETLNIATVYLVEYPTGLFDDAHGDPRPGCELFETPPLSPLRMDIDREDAILVKKVAESLNDKLAGIANHHHWVFVTGIADRFEDHGYCLYPGQRWFRTCGESLFMQGDTEGTIHPNALGQRAIGEQIAKELCGHTIKPGLSSGNGVHGGDDPVVSNGGRAPTGSGGLLAPVRRLVGLITGRR